MTARRLFKAAISRALSTFLRRRIQNGPGGVVVLLFHKVTDDEEWLSIAVGTQLFDQIISTIRSVGAMASLEEWVKTDFELPQTGLKFIITFDDGYADNYHNAWPILKAHSAPASIFLSTDAINAAKNLWSEELQWIMRNGTGVIDLPQAGIRCRRVDDQSRRSIFSQLNRWLKLHSADVQSKVIEEIRESIAGDSRPIISPMLTWEEVALMHHDGCRFGSHGMTHPILANESKARQQIELAESKKEIETKLGTAISTFAYPNGRSEDFTGVTVSLLQEAGYLCGLTTMGGVNRNQVDPYRVRRVNIHHGMCTNGQGKFDPNLLIANLLGVFL